MSDTIEKLATTKVKVTINFPARLWELVERIAEDEGISRTEVLRRAISLEKFRRDVAKEGSQLAVVTSDGAVERLHFQY